MQARCPFPKVRCPQGRGGVLSGLAGSVRQTPPAPVSSHRNEHGQRGCFLALGCLPWLSEALQTVLCWHLRSSQERPSHPQLRTGVQVSSAPPSRAGNRPPTHKAKGRRWELRPGFVLTKGPWRKPGAFFFLPPGVQLYKSCSTLETNPRSGQLSPLLRFCPCSRSCACVSPVVLPSVPSLVP